MTAIITNPIAKAAIEALQKGDVQVWKSQFAPNAVLLDDGHPRDLQKFSEEAVGHERFVSIDSVEDDGLKLEGEFQSEVWGRFRTYFRFTVSQQGQITKLEIGQA